VRPPAIYIRGATGKPVDRTRVRAVVTSSLLAVVAAVLVVTTLGMLAQASELGRLRAQGIPVSVSVTGCAGIASGTGITTVGYTCRGTFTVRGRRFDDVIRGNTALLDTGQRVQGVAFPTAPTRLYASSSLRTSESPSSRLPVLLPALAAVALLTVGWRLARLGFMSRS
jgi:hypothetical protein